MTVFGTKVAIWRSLDVTDGLELVWLGDNEARGALMRPDEEGRLFRVSYRFLWNADLLVRAARLEAHVGSECRGMNLIHEETWSVDEEEIKGFEACRDLDLWPTPLTNSFAIRRLGLAIGERREIEVLWIEAPSFRYIKSRQAYTRLDDRRYLFESIASGFQAKILVDEHGLVLEYPGLFERVPATEREVARARDRLGETMSHSQQVLDRGGRLD